MCSAFASSAMSKTCVCVCVYMSVRLTGTAERLLGRDALVAGRAERGGRHGQRGEQVAVAVARLPLARFLLPLLHALLLFVLHTHTQRNTLVRWSESVIFVLQSHNPSYCYSTDVGNAAHNNMFYIMFSFSWLLMFYFKSSIPGWYKNKTIVKTERGVAQACFDKTLDGEVWARWGCLSDPAVGFVLSCTHHSAFIFFFTIMTKTWRPRNSHIHPVASRHRAATWLY